MKPIRLIVILLLSVSIYATSQDKYKDAFTLYSLENTYGCEHIRTEGGYGCCYKVRGKSLLGQTEFDFICENETSILSPYEIEGWLQKAFYWSRYLIYSVPISPMEYWNMLDIEFVSFEIKETHTIITILPYGSFHISIAYKDGDFDPTESEKLTNGDI